MAGNARPTVLAAICPTKSRRVRTAHHSMMSALPDRDGGQCPPYGSVARATSPRTRAGRRRARRRRPQSRWMPGRLNSNCSGIDSWGHEVVGRTNPGQAPCRAGPHSCEVFRLPADSTHVPCSADPATNRLLPPGGLRYNPAAVRRILLVAACRGRALTLWRRRNRR